MKMWTLWKVKNDQTLPILVHEWLDCCFLSSYSLSLAWSFLLLGKIKIPNPRVTSTFWQHLMKSEDLFLKPTPEAFNTSQNPIIPLLKYPITLHDIWFPRLQKKKQISRTLQVQVCSWRTGWMAWHSHLPSLLLLLLPSLWLPHVIICLPCCTKSFVLL